VRVKVVKNKVAPPFRSAEFDILADGISREGALIDAALEHLIFEKSGTWMSYGDIRLGQGRENVRGYLRENPALADEIEVRVRTKAAEKSAASAPPAVPAPRAPLPNLGDIPSRNGSAPMPEVTPLEV
jgi:recombination protein RecA